MDVSGVGVARVGGGTEDVASGLVGFGGSVGSRVDLSSAGGASVGATAVVGRSVLPLAVPNVVADAAALPEAVVSCKRLVLLVVARV